ncbi:hypothetical protein MNBD_DELTA03-246 [hydrothermal vent metagenome]|uniref:Polysaccharide chain length determinant N-terminal domain-containing protein n=1 Tax=hydrothermal vent metagenome TaxID=652676 RepID=A0A3B0W4H2_9ZZZZ
MEQQQRQQTRKYVSLLLRRKKIIVSFVLLSLFGGLAFYLKSPKVYESTALLIYERAKINPGSMTPHVQTRTREMIATLTQQVTSRSSLEAIIKQFNLYPGARRKLPMEDVVDFMRSNNIIIKPEKGDVFEVTFQGQKPQQVMQVANALAAKFIEENLRYREERATETSAYASDEMKISQATLSKKEAAMRDYKLKYYNEMPQQFQSNMTRLNALQNQLQKNADSIQNLERTKVMIQEQITKRKDALNQLTMQAQQLGGTISPSDQALNADSPLASVINNINRSKAALSNLLLRYTSRHPEVKRLKKKLAELEKKKAELEKEMPPSATGKNGANQNSTDSILYSRDKQLSQLYLQLTEASFNIKLMRKNGKDIQKQIKQYQKWIAKTPVREAEWTALTRDYKQLYDHFQKLLVRNLEAESAQSLERRQKGSQFKIVDSAFYPGKPTKPDFRRIMFVALGLGLALGGGLALFLEMGDTSFRDAEDLENFLDLPVVCSLPLIVSEKEKKLSRLKAIGWFTFFLIGLAALTAVILHYYNNGRIIL